MNTYIIVATGLVLALFVFYAIMSDVSTGALTAIAMCVLFVVGVLIFLYWKRDCIAHQWFLWAMKSLEPVVPILLWERIVGKQAGN